MRVHLVPDHRDDDDDYDDDGEDGVKNYAHDDDDDDNLVACEVTEARWSSRWTRQFWWKLSL